MCKGCWDEISNCEIIKNDKVERASELIDKVYEYHLAGGNLHIVVDDWNLEDGSIDFCENQIMENPHDSSKAQLKAEKECLNALRDLTMTERASALANHDGYW